MAAYHSLLKVRHSDCNGDDLLQPLQHHAVALPDAPERGGRPERQGPPSGPWRLGGRFSIWRVGGLGAGQTDQEGNKETARLLLKHYYNRSVDAVSW